MTLRALAPCSTRRRPPLSSEPRTLGSEVTEDELLSGRIRLLQPKHGYRVAVDPVLLAAAVPAGPGDLVLDAGTGTGAAALCLAARAPGCRIVGLEMQVALVELARRNVAGNGLGERIDLVAGDLAAWAPEGRQPFDHVMSNPPFLDEARGSLPPDPQRRMAHVLSMQLPAWIDVCLRRLRPGGNLTMIHRADRLDTILASLSGRAGAVTVIPLWPREGAPAARRVIVRAIKGSRAPVFLSRGLVLHDATGQFTAAAEAILRHAAALTP